ncbi:fatty acyl-CoA reductase wat-like isoform X1 [Vespula squamosa]|uniref:Fatty acyl-CoA reductase wat-like isoform X1 n=1 Tax=Vespula squamosa TaxID=30214 RepID=A0ABD2BS85_VESSQ
MKSITAYFFFIYVQCLSDVTNLSKEMPKLKVPFLSCSFVYVSYYRFYNFAYYLQNTIEEKFYKPPMVVNFIDLLNFTNSTHKV